MRNANKEYPAKPAVLEILRLIALFAAIQAADSLVSFAARRFLPEWDLLTDRFLSILFMMFVTATFFIICKKRAIALHLLPEKRTPLYIAAALVVVLLVVSSPAFLFAKERSAEDMLLTLYSILFIPVYEEIIFRGYAWSRLCRVIRNEWLVCAIVAVLFAVWHLGYIYTISLRVNGNLATIMYWKMITGLCYGAVLCPLRKLSKNCASTVLLHATMNIFAR